MAITNRTRLAIPVFVCALSLAALAEEHGAPKDAHGVPKEAPAKDTRALVPTAVTAPVAKPMAAAAAAHASPAREEKPAVQTNASPVRPRPPAVRRVAPGAIQPPGAGAAREAEKAAPQAAPPTPQPHAVHWSYEGGTGPEAWARLAPEFAQCASGARQSPIDIRDGMKLELEQIAFDYRPSSFRVIDNGHTIQANVSGWNSIRVMGRRYALVQFHFHRPSEEMIDGRLFDMVVHLVHKDNEGRLAVVAVLVEKGARQQAIQAVLNNLPLEKGEETAAAGMLDMNQLLPESRKYYTYMGSLTTPPCTEGVLWVVMKQPVQATGDQLNLFARMYPMNARPIQSSAGRTIKESN
jgi:carbonic anhydrase